MAKLSVGSMLLGELTGLAVIPYYLHQTQQNHSLVRMGITIGSMACFGLWLPLKICHKLESMYSSKDKNKQKAKTKPKPLRSILMLYICLWLYKIIQMSLDKNFFKRCNITKSWQSVLASIVPGVFLFDPKLKSIPNYNWKPRTFLKLLEFIGYGFAMFLEIKICQKYSIKTLKNLPKLLQYYMFYIFIASWIQMQNNLLPLITSFILRDKVYIKFPYKTAILSLGWQEFWKRWSVSIGSALRYTIYYPLIKVKGYHPFIAILAVFMFNAFMHHWFCVLLEDKPHFKSYCIAMFFLGLATFVEVYLKRNFKITKKSNIFKLFFFIWHTYSLYKVTWLQIETYKAIPITMEDLQGDNLT